MMTVEEKRAKRREANRRWRKAHPEQAKAANLKWRNAHPDKVKEMSKRWHLKLKGEIKAPTPKVEPKAPEAAILEQESDNFIEKIVEGL